MKYTSSASSDQTVAFENYIKDLGRLGEYYSPLFNKAFEEALEDFNREHADTMRLYNTREMANIMHAHLRDRVKANFHAVDGIHFEEGSNTAFKVIIDGRPIGINAVGFVKLKKSSKFFRTSNIITKTVKRFMTQQTDNLSFTPAIQESLFPDLDISSGLKTTKVVNLPDFVNLVANYCPNKTWSAFNRLAITFPISINQVKMVVDFTEVIANVAEQVVDIQPQPVTKSSKRVRSRRSADKPGRTKLRKFIESASMDNNTEEITRKKKSK